MEEKYLEVSLLGISCYTDAFIADQDSQILYFISLFGRPSSVKAVGAAIIDNRDVAVGNLLLRRPPWKLRTFTQNLGGGLVHRIIICEECFTGDRLRILVGEDKTTAFSFLDSVVSTPLKEEWAESLWKKVFEPKSLLGFGALEGRDLNEVYLVTLDKTVDEVDSIVLDGIRAGELN